ncbi:MAG: hypothetical protein D6727_08540 [Gammaproteobacteria bacterium]|nr:MAG: hypothetical protein D6727_08540 [Gammaproteobacteria bacterium]
MNRAGLIALLAASVAAPVHAADPEPETETAMYAVEIIVFEYLDQQRNTPEAPPPLTGFDGPVAAASSGPQPDFLLLEPHPQANFRPLPPEALELTGIWNRLQELDAYRPLLHAGWIQPGRSRELAEPILIGVHLPSVPGLSGQFLLSKERYEHLRVALQYQPPAAADGWPATRPVAAEIDESRRLRGDLLQYFDHPRFGVVARVRALPPPGDGETAPPD